MIFGISTDFSREISRSETRQALNAPVFFNFKFQIIFCLQHPAHSPQRPTVFNFEFQFVFAHNAHPARGFFNFCSNF